MLPNRVTLSINDSHLTWTGMVILVSSLPMHCLRNDHRFSSDFSGCATGSVVRHAEYSSAGLLSSCCKNQEMIKSSNLQYCE